MIEIFAVYPGDWIAQLLRKMSMVWIVKVEKMHDPLEKTKQKIW